jgi:hypothetical protein
MRKTQIAIGKGRRVIRAVAVWIAKTIGGAIFGQAALQFFHLLGVHPDQLLATGMAKAFRSTALAPQILENAGWIFAAIGVALVWIAAAVGRVVKLVRQRSRKQSLADPNRIAVGIDTSQVTIGDFGIVCAVTLQNLETRSLERCVVQIDQYSGALPKGMPFPLTLRTDPQIRAKLSGPFPLLAGQTATIPVLVGSPISANEWFLVDESGKSYFVPANPLKMVLGVYGGEKPENFLLVVETDAGWKARPLVQPVDGEFRLPFGPGTRVATPRWQRVQIMEIFSLAEAKFGWDFEGQRSLDILDFIFGLHQAGVDGDVKFYGKLNRNDFESLTRNERLVEIDRTHWQDYELDIWKARSDSDNFFVWTLNKRSKDWKSGGFADIHADRQQMMNWLETEADGYKGHTRQSTKGSS